MSEFLRTSVFRWAQLIVAILGLGFSIACSFVYGILVTLYALILIYLVAMIICSMSSRLNMSGSMQAIIEVVSGILLLAYTIFFLTSATKDVMGILTIVCGFVLSAMLFISAYERIG